MSAFTDLTGQSHQVTIDLDVALRLKAVGQMDLLQCLKTPETLPEILHRIGSDPVELVAALAVILDLDDVKALQRVFDGQVLADAGEALLQAIIDFFPQGQRTILNRLLTSQKAYQTHTIAKATEHAAHAIDRLDWSTVLRESQIRGNGLNESSPASEVTAAASHSGS